MSELYVFPICLYLINSISSCLYTRSFLQQKYCAALTLPAWTALGFLLQLAVLELLDRVVSIGEVGGILFFLLLLLLLQRLFFQQDRNKQMFVIFSFTAGIKAVHFITTGVFWSLLHKPYTAILQHISTQEVLAGPGQTLLGAKAALVLLLLLCLSLYALLLSVYLRLCSRKFVRKDYRLQRQEHFFLLLPCIAALCISATLQMVIVSVEHGTTRFIYDTVPATKFWIPLICALLLAAILAGVILFQKLVQYHEEVRRRAMLEQQVRQLQKELADIQEVYADLKGLRHDLRSHLANISLLAHHTDDAVRQELEAYLGNMQQTVDRLDFTHQTGNPITDTIIQRTLLEAQKKQVECIVDFTYPPQLSLDSYDIAVILTNALENALEACSTSRGARQVRLRSYVKGSLFLIEVENDFSDELVFDKQSGLPLSRKEPQTLHGIGISNIQRCAQNYMGGIDIAVTQADGAQRFCLTVMLNGACGVKGATSLEN